MKISPPLSPELLAMLYRMGHGGEIVLADAHFLGNSTNANLLCVDGSKVANFLNERLLLVSQDSYVDSLIFMTIPVPEDQANSSV